MADNKRFTLATYINVYLYGPYHPWQSGTNETTNGLLRKCVPKGTDLSVHSQARLYAVARRLNERPRKGRGRLQYRILADLSRCSSKRSGHIIGILKASNAFNCNSNLPKTCIANGSSSETYAA